MAFTAGSDAGITGFEAKYHYRSDEIRDARVHAGLHFRSSVDAGEELGKKVVGHVLAEKFQVRS